MKQYVIISIMCLCSSLACAQSFSLDGLTGKTWRGVSGYVGEELLDITFVFTEQSLMFKAWQKCNTSDVVTHIYDIIVSLSDNRLALKATNGNIIVYESE